MANEIRIARLEEIIKQVINNALNYEVNNPIAKHATVTTVKLTSDLGIAKVYLDCLHRENIDKIILNVNRLKGFLRTKLSRNLDTYKVPELVFLSDSTIDYANNIEALLKQISKKG